VEAVIPDDHPDDPYRLCAPCARRLHDLALRPLEWFNLAALHGPFCLLHDDFYDGRGVAGCPIGQVEEPRRFPAPKLIRIRGDLERLVDYAMSRVWLLKQERLLTYLRRHDPLQLLHSLQRRVVASAGNLAIETMALRLSGLCVGEPAADWVRERWAEPGNVDLLDPLAEASAACLPFEEAFARVTAVLDGLSQKGLNEQIHALAWFRSSRSLAWMEAHRVLATTDAWGWVAASSTLSWPKVLEWLNSGRPLSHVALAALRACYCDERRISRHPAPQLLEAPSFKEMAAALDRYAAQDGVPNVRNRVYDLKYAWGL
jgi:hypothetical protein